MALLSGRQVFAERKDAADDVGRRRQSPADTRQLNQGREASRVLVSCSKVEAMVFGISQHSSMDVGRREFADTSNKASSAKAAKQSGMNEDVVGSEASPAMALRNGANERPADVSRLDEREGGENNTAKQRDLPASKQAGRQKAHERELVRCAARRGVAFGFITGTPAEGEPRLARRKCEAVVQGKVVEPSFAKGDWSIRWRKREE